MPPRPTKNFYVPPNIKKKPLAASNVSPASSSSQEEKKRREIARGEHKRHERLELEDGDQQLEAYAEHDPEIEDREEEGRELDEEEHHDGAYAEHDPEIEDREDEGRELDEEEHHDGAKESRETNDFNVYVGKLDRRVTEEDLRDAFSPVGDIVSVRLIKYRNRAFAFIQFATVEQASRSLREVPNPLVNGKQCRVGPCYKNKTLSVGETSSHPESRRMVGPRRSSPEKSNALQERDRVRQSYALRETDRARHRSKHSPEKAYCRRSPASPYGRSYRDAYHGNPPRSPSLAAARRVSHRFDDNYSYDSHSYRDAYLRYRGDYGGSSSYKDMWDAVPRNPSSAAARRVSQRYDDDYSYDSHGRDYTSISGSKRFHSAVEEVGPHYFESPTKRSRTRYDCGGSGSRAPYADSSRVEGDHSSAGYSQGIHNTRTSSMGYRADEMRRGNEERMHRSSYERERVPSRGDLRGASSLHDYHSRGKDDSHPSRGSGSRH